MENFIPKAEHVSFFAIQGNASDVVLRCGQQLDTKDPPVHVVSLALSPHMLELLHRQLGAYLEQHRERFGPIPDPGARIVQAPPPRPLRPV